MTPRRFVTLLACGLDSWLVWYNNWVAKWFRCSVVARLLFGHDGSFKMVVCPIREIGYLIRFLVLKAVSWVNVTSTMAYLTFWRVSYELV